MFIDYESATEFYKNNFKSMNRFKMHQYINHINNCETIRVDRNLYVHRREGYPDYYSGTMFPEQIVKDHNNDDPNFPSYMSFHETYYMQWNDEFAQKTDTTILDYQGWITSLEYVTTEEPNYCTVNSISWKRNGMNDRKFLPALISDKGEHWYYYDGHGIDTESVYNVAKEHDINLINPTTEDKIILSMIFND